MMTIISWAVLVFLAFFMSLLWVQVFLSIVFGFIQKVMACQLVTKISFLDKLEEKFGKQGVTQGFSSTFN